MQKIIITGGTGYLGSHTAAALINAGFSVVLFDNLCNSNESVIDGITEITGTRPEFVHVDLADAARARDAFSVHTDAIAVIHFAGLKAVGESVAKPILYYKNNLNATINVLDNMREFGIQNLVFSSSACVYGEPKQLPITEETPLCPAMSPYGATKVMGEEIIRDVIAANTNLHAIILRYFNPIGAHPSAKIGENPRGVPNNLLPYITQVAMGIREKLSVFGNDYETPDGFCVRDYIDVNDLADAHVAAVRRMIAGAQKSSAEVFNIGTGHGTSVMELLRAFETANNIKIKYEIAPRRAGDVAANWADVARAEHELHWHATRPLVETLRSAWAWQKNATGID